MDEMRGILDDLAEDMEYDRPVEEDDVFIGHIRSGKNKISREGVAASTSDDPTSDTASVAEAPTETTIPVRNATTLTSRSYGPAGEGGVALGYAKEAAGIVPHSYILIKEGILAVGQLTRSKKSLSKERWGKCDWQSDEKALSQ